jgi:uncharacterized protein
MQATTIAEILRYPVKGLNPDRLTTVSVTPGEGLPWDRAFAFTHGQSKFDPAAPEHMGKRNFLMLMRNARMAKIDARFDTATQMLSLALDGTVRAQGDVNSIDGRRKLAAFVLDFAGSEAFGRVDLVSAHGFMFSDVKEKCLSIINRATCADIATHAGGPVDPLRFRGNLLLDGLPPWAEFDWVGKTLQVGTVRLHVYKRIDRCAATEVNPATAERDLHTVRLLAKTYGHVDCGVYALVETGGTLSVGDNLSAA